MPHGGEIAPGKELCPESDVMWDLYGVGLNIL